MTLLEVPKSRYAQDSDDSNLNLLPLLKTHTLNTKAPFTLDNLAFNKTLFTFLSFQPDDPPACFQHGSFDCNLGMTCTTDARYKNLTPTLIQNKNARIFLFHGFFFLIYSYNESTLLGA